MKWKVELDFCSDGVTYSSAAPREYHYYPKLKITTNEELTEAEKRTINNELVKAASAMVGYGIGEVAK